MFDSKLSRLQTNVTGGISRALGNRYLKKVSMDACFKDVYRLPCQGNL